MAVLDYLPKLKRDLRLAFGAYFQHDFLKQILSYLVLNGQSFNTIPYFLLKISNEMCY